LISHLDQLELLRSGNEMEIVDPQDSIAVFGLVLQCQRNFIGLTKQGLTDVTEARSECGWKAAKLPYSPATPLTGLQHLLAQTGLAHAHFAFDQDKSGVTLKGLIQGCE
jgi:hypothetical protein